MTISQNRTTKASNLPWQLNFVPEKDVEGMSCHLVYLVALRKLGETQDMLTDPYRYRSRLIYMQGKISKAASQEYPIRCFTELDYAISSILSLTQETERLELWECIAFGDVFDDPRRKPHQKSMAVMYIEPTECLGNQDKIFAEYKERKKKRKGVAKNEQGSVSRDNSSTFVQQIRPAERKNCLY